MVRSEQESYAHNKARREELERRHAEIRRLNDQLRTTGIGGRWMVTPGIRGLGPSALAQVLDAVRGFSDFTPDNDPAQEHDFGCVTLAQLKVFWKIDYYDKRLEFGSPEPADPELTARVLTVMLAEEY